MFCRIEPWHIYETLTDIFSLTCKSGMASLWVIMFVVLAVGGNCVHYLPLFCYCLGILLISPMLMGIRNLCVINSGDFWQCLDTGHGSLLHVEELPAPHALVHMAVPHRPSGMLWHLYMWSVRLGLIIFSSILHSPAVMELIWISRDYSWVQQKSGQPPLCIFFFPLYIMF